VKVWWRRIPALTVLLGATVVGAAPVPVRLPEGPTRGSLTIRSADGRRIGHGPGPTRAR
jgi:hypothetical protein